jgi:arabinofuranosyltransferase
VLDYSPLQLAETKLALLDLGRRYVALLVSQAPPVLGLAGLTIAVGVVYRKAKAFFNRHAALIHPPILLASLAVGFVLALRQTSLVDDAFISFRYARNLVEGHGLVFNIGERVEGYTNFLWTIILAAGSRLFPLDIPWQAVILGLICFAANLLVVYRIGRALHPRGPATAYVPIAVILLATSRVFTAYATTGLETMAASLLVNLGLLFLLTAANRSGWFWSGLMFFLAIMTRPDQAIFLAAALPLVLFGWTTKPEGRRRRGYFFASLPVLLAYLVWKYHYYGSIIPNTFFSREPEYPHLLHGLVYTALFFLATNFWVIAVLFFLWLALPGGIKSAKPLKWFAGVSFALTSIYILYFGGDWMHGRFFASLMPIVFLGVENLVYRFPRPEKRTIPTWVILALAAVVFSTIGVAASYPRVYFGEGGWWGNGEMIDVGHETGGNAYLDLAHFKNDHPGVERAMTFRRYFFDRGIMATIMLSAIGMDGYFSRLPIMDYHGLTDIEIGRRAPPATHEAGLIVLVGHTRRPTDAYLASRRVDFVWGQLPPEQRPVWRRTNEHYLTLFQYNPEIMTLVRRHVPELGIIDFVAFLDHYLANLGQKNKIQVQQDFEDFKKFYFVRGRDPRRRQIFESYLGSH